MLRKVLVLASVFVAGAASAQTGRMFVTVDGIVANCEAVYSGVITKIEYGEASYPYRTRKARFSVRIEETLKGPPQKELSVECVPFIPEPELEKFVAKRVPFLWVSRPKDVVLASNLLGKMAHGYDVPEPAYFWFRLYEPGSMDRYVDFDSNVFTADFRVISSWKDFMKEARQAAKAYPGTVELLPLYMPHSVTRMCGDPNAFGVLSVPKSKELKELAKRLVEDPARVIREARKKSRRVYKEPVLSEEDVKYLRSEGERLLRDFEKEGKPAGQDGPAHTYSPLPLYRHID